MESKPTAPANCARGADDLTMFVAARLARSPVTTVGGQVTGASRSSPRRPVRRIHAGRLLAPLLLGVAAACHAYRPVDGAGVAPQETVRVRLGTPRDLVVNLARGDTILLRRVTELEGRIAAVAGDTLLVRPLVLVQTADGTWADDRQGPTSALVVRDGGTEVLARRFERRQAWIAAGLVVVALAAVYAIGSSGGGSSGY